MKRVIRNKLTRAYLTADGGWTLDFGLAHDFKDVGSALRASKRHQTTELELVLVMGASPSPQYDIELPLPGSSDQEAP